MKRFILAVALLLAMTGTSFAQDSQSMTLAVQGGTIASLSADASGVAPFSTVVVNAPLSKTVLGPRLRVSATLSALPGESITLEDPQSYRSLSFSVAISQPIKPSILSFSIYAEAGFASRLAADPAPRDKAPRWGSGGFLFQNDAGDARLAIGIGGDQRLSGRWMLACQVSGQVPLPLGEVKGVRAFLVGQALLGLDIGTVDPMATKPRDSIQVGIALGT